MADLMAFLQQMMRGKSSQAPEGSREKFDSFVNKLKGAMGETVAPNETLSGIPEQFGQMKTSTPEQDEFTRGLYQSGGGLNQNPLFQQGQDWLSRILSNDPQSMQQFEAPYMQNFEERILPTIAERFAGMGTGAGGLNSSGFQQTLAHAGRGLQSDLAQMRAGLQSGASQQGLQYAQQPISNQMNALSFKPHENTYTPRQPGFVDSLANAIPGLAVSGLTGFMNNQNNNNYSNSMNRLNSMSNSIYNS